MSKNEELKSLRAKLHEKITGSKITRKSRGQQQAIMCKKMGIDKAKLEEIIKQMNNKK